uniref:Interleukin-12 subunit beta n=1 Tax=Sphenodon punctatus TaxID=8508 RepID=A0A8D0HTM8_SPHPU
MPHLLFMLLSLLSFAIPLEAKWKLRDNVYVIDSEWSSEAPVEDVELICNVSDDKAGEVYWMKDQEKKGNGKILVTKVKEFLDAGNYTCWRGDTQEIISYNFLLISKKDSNGPRHSILKSFKEPNNRTYFKCEARNYSGIFVCSWITENRPSNVQFTIRKTVSCEAPVPTTKGSLTEYSVRCWKGSYCPFAEEHQQVEMFLEVIDDTEYENSTAKFFIRDIIKPDPPKCHYLAQNDTVSWKYPKSWSTPESYFPLTFRVRIENKQNKNYAEIRDVDEQFTKVPMIKRKMVYIQARDRYYNSSWSSWSEVCR